MEPNPDGTLTVFDRKLTTREVEQLMHDLAEARNLMTPQVPVDLRDSEVNIVFQGDADFAISTSADHQIVFACRHRGYGWMVFGFPPERARFIAMGMLRRVGGEPVDLPSQDEGQRH